MKKKIFALMAAMAVVLMTACGGAVYTPGVFTTTGYESEYLGFRFTTPEECVLSTEEELSEMTGVALDALGDDIVEIQKKYAEITTIYELVVTDASGAANANIVLEKTDVSLDTYIEVFKKQIQELTVMTVNFLGDAQEVEFARAAYTKLSAEVESGGVSMYQDYYMRKAGDRMVCITLTWAEGYDAEIATIKNAFSAY